jgi:hypothetical protein
MRDGLKKEKIGQSAAKLLSRKSGEGSTTRINHLRLRAMMMKSIGETMYHQHCESEVPGPY